MSKWTEFKSKTYNMTRRDPGKGILLGILIGAAIGGVLADISNGAGAAIVGNERTQSDGIWVPSSFYFSTHPDLRKRVNDWCASGGADRIGQEYSVICRNALEVGSANNVSGK